MSEILKQPTLKQLIDHLSDGEFHSGEQLGKVLGVTRSAIWKLIKQLKSIDIEIESVTNKGYRILGGLNLLKEEKILAQIEKEQKSWIEQIQIFDSLPSTNDYLLQKNQNHKLQSKPSKSQIPKCLILFAESQTAGKGRLGRVWISPYAKNIYVSLLWHFPRDPSELSGLSLAIAVAVSNALLKHSLLKLDIQENLSVKWPNDILWKNQKLGGILIEFSCEANNICNTVIGIGLNVDMPKMSGEKISQPWIDLKTILGKTEKNIDRNEISGLLLNELIKSLILFQNEGLSPFIPQWQSLDATFGLPITVTTPIKTIQGINRGINASGHLLLESEIENKKGQKEIKSYSSGEISILKS